MKPTVRSDFCVLLFASDINVYSVARAFHEAYGIVVDAFGKADSGPCVGSRIIRYDHHPQADTQEVFLAKVLDFAAAILSRVRSRPRISRASNNGGPTVRPVTATRTGA